MWPLKTILYFTLFWVACVLSLINPIWGVVNYIMTYQMNPADTWWGAPLVRLGIRFSMLAAMFALLGMVLGRKHARRIQPRISLWEIGIVLLVIFAAIGMIQHPGHTPDSRYSFEKLWKMMFFVLLLARVTATRENLRLVLWALTAGSLFIGYQAFTAPPSSFWLGRLELIGGPDFSSTSGAAAHLAAMLPLIGVVFLTTPRWRWRLAAVLAGALSFNAIILCRTRSAFVGMLFGILTAVVLAPRAKRFRIHALLAIGCLAAFSLTDPYFWTRMSTLTNPETLHMDVAAANRIEIWKTSLRIIQDQPFGVGPGNFPYVIAGYAPQFYRRSSHNTVLVCFTELGIHGGVLFLGLVALSFWYLYRCVRLAAHSRRPVETSLIAYGCLVSAVTYFITGLGTERFYCESFWWVLTLPLCLYRTVLSEMPAEEETFVPVEGTQTTPWELPPPEPETGYEYA
ncbi:MAG: hypothetical protein D6788_05065 [Planctomycetota bacterium]|nr:MAG: hypothetical protein D6788_05065 [Planctomycetota bacterium]